MSAPGMFARRCALGLVALLAGSACDLIAEAGQTLVLANRGSVFGTGENGQNPALPAVRVQPGGAVVVQDADLFGGGIVVQRTLQRPVGPREPGSGPIAAR